MEHNRLTDLFQQIKVIRNAADDVDIFEQSGLPQDVIDAIENSEAGLSEITFAQLSDYLLPLDYTLDLKTDGMGKLNPHPSVVTIVLKPISQTVVSLGTAPAPL